MGKLKLSLFMLALITIVLFFVFVKIPSTENHLKEYHSDSYLRTYDSNFERETLITCGSKPFKYSYVGGEGFKDDYYLNSTKKDPTVKKVMAGTNFTYECSTSNKDTFRIYKYGLFEKGFPAPSKLICRVEVKEQSRFCTVKWAKEKSSSRYFGRISVKYNRVTHSMIWTLHNVSHGDENTFIAIFKDNFASGQGFKECLPVILQVTEAKATVRSTPTPPTSSATSYKRQTKRTDEKEYTTPTQLTPTPPGPTLLDSKTASTSSSTFSKLEVVIIVVVVLVVLLLPTCTCAWLKRKKIKEKLCCQTLTNEEQEKDGIRFQSSSNTLSFGVTNPVEQFYQS